MGKEKDVNVVLKFSGQALERVPLADIRRQLALSAQQLAGALPAAAQAASAAALAGRALLSLHTNRLSHVPPGAHAP